MSSPDAGGPLTFLACAYGTAWVEVLWLEAEIGVKIVCTLLPWRRPKHLVGSWVLILAQIVSAAPTAFSQQPRSWFQGATQVRPAVDQLHGPVRRIRTEIAPVSLRDGKPVEGRRVLFKQATFSADEVKKDDFFYPAKISDPAAAEQQYIYDNNGHVTKVVVRDATGQVLAHYHYRYEFDRYGNWTKRVSYVAIVHDGISALEPTEVAYRRIEYYPTRAYSRVRKPLAEARVTAGPITRSAKAADTSAAQGLALSPPIRLSHGEVSLHLGLSPDGEVISAKASGGPNRLIYSLAEELARHARFSPELLREALTDGGGLPTAAAGGDLSFQRVRVVRAVAKVTPNRMELTLYLRLAARNGERAPEETGVATITAILSKTKGRWEMVGSFIGGK